jgi:hypothetical protein
VKKAPKPKPAARSAPKKQPAAARSAPKKKPATRADLGAPIDGFFARQPQPQRGILDALRALVVEAAPDAVGSIKWGMPFFTAGGMMCALTAHKSHVNLVLAGPPGTYADPDGRLEGDGKTGKHLKLRTLDDLPRPQVRAWLRTAAKLARSAGR